MRIGINGRFLVAKQTGVQRAAYNLVKTLVDIDKDNEYFLFTGESQLTNPDWDSPNVKVVASNLKKGGHIKNHLWEQFTLPKIAKKYAVDILHSPANMAPLFFCSRSVVHIHDLCFVVNPQWYSYLFHTVYNLVIPRLAKKATRVITNSNNSRNDLLRFFDVSSEKVSLVYWAVDNTFMKRSTQDVDSKEVSLSDDLLEDGYILYVGSLEPRKNIPTLVEAYEKLRNSNPGLRTKLVLIGGESPLFADVRLKIKKYKEDVLFKGFVNDAILCEYYEKATVLAYPSLYEGFGLPPLEAMASGVPVVTSNTSSIPEVVGDSALMVSPYDSGQLAEALARVIRNKDLREQMRQKGYEQVKKFNWYRVARNILAVYYEIYNEKLEEDKDPHIPFEFWKKLVLLEKVKTGVKAIGAKEHQSKS